MTNSDTNPIWLPWEVMGFGVAVSVPDGVAVATDSRVLAGMLGGPEVPMSDTQQKIVPISTNVAVLAIDPYYLDGDVQVNVRSTLEQIRPDIPRSATLEEVLSELPGRFRSAAGVTADSDHEITLRLIGYSQEQRAVRVVNLPGLKDPVEMHSTALPGIDWFGFVDIATRLIKGTSTVVVDGATTGDEIEFLVPVPMMSLDDALDLAETLVETTVTFGKFVKGVGAKGKMQSLQIPVGGRVQSAVVRPDGFRWVNEPVWSVKPPQPFPELGANS